jgi:hypothetical protein
MKDAEDEKMKRRRAMIADRTAKAAAAARLRLRPSAGLLGDKLPA